MARIFISYAREDSESARMLAEALSEYGHSVWWDAHIRGGEHYSAEIGRELESADFVVVLWSPCAAASHWVLDEAAEARDSGRLLPVALDGCKPPLGFRQIQAISLPAKADSSSRAVSVLVDSIAAKAEAGENQVAGDGATRRRERRLSICVLPFANIGNDPDQEYFSDGITEDVITDLSLISRLDVVARNIAFSYRGQSIDEKEIAAVLGATHVVEGTVRKFGNRLRISAQLIEGSTARQLWAQRFDRDFTDIFAIQDEISGAIVKALELELLPSETKAIEVRSTSDAEAYDLYLKARRRWATAGTGNGRASNDVVNLCSKATEIDPHYALGWALLALAQSDLALWSGGTADPAAAAERALSIDPDVPEGHCVLARMAAEQGDWDSAHREIETALRLDPESWDASRDEARLFLAEGRADDAVAALERASAASRTDHESPSELVRIYASAGDRAGVRRSAELAIARAERIVISDPKNGAAYSSGACGLAALGHGDRGRKWIRKALNTEPANLAMRCSAASTLAFFFGAYEAALDVLEPFAEAIVGCQQLKRFESDAAWACLRDLPRFAEILEQARQRVNSRHRIQ